MTSTSARRIVSILAGLSWLLLSSSELHAQFCGGPYVATNQAHVSAGRATASSTTNCSTCWLQTCSLFCPGTTVTTYTSVGGAINLGTSGSATTTLYESPAGRYSTTVCSPCAGTETCGNGTDDDCDGEIDCADGECFSAASCNTCGNAICESLRAEDPVSCPGDCGGVAPSNCPIDYPTLSGPRSWWSAFSAVDANGVVDATNRHPDDYYMISGTHPLDGMKDRDAWIREMPARLNGPIVRPWRDHPDAKVMGTVNSKASWSEHGQAIDVNVGGPTFKLYAMADGEVIFVGYHPSMGNVVVMEYTMPSGERFRSLYHHVRNGRDNDLALAQATQSYCVGRACDFSSCTYTKADGTPDTAECNGWQQYQAAADQAVADLNDGDPSNDAAVETQWGTNAQSLAVTPGTPVRLGQFIGWAGDTGVHSGSVHLHWRVARPALHMSGGVQQTRWTSFDPSGLYSGMVACYQTAYPTGQGGTDPRQHASLLAPHHDVFGNVDYDTFLAGRAYYGRYSMNLRTLTAEFSNAAANWRFAGAYGTSNIRDARVVVDHATFQTVFQSMWNQNLVPDHMSVEDTIAPRYTAVFRPRNGDYWASNKMTAAWVTTRAAELGSSFVLVDYVPYVENGSLFFSAAWEKRPGAAAVPIHGLTRTALETYATTMASLGFKMTRSHRYNHPGQGVRYAALWRNDQPGTTLRGEFTNVDDLQDWSNVFKALWNGRVLHMTADQGVYGVIYEF